MSDLDELIQADAENILNSRRALADFDPEFPGALDTAAGMFKTFSRCMKGALDDSSDLSTLNECAKELAVNGDALISLIGSESRGQQPALDRARTSWLHIYARRARGIVFLLLQRQFMWAASDLLRMRVTPAIGYCRQEAESLALLFMMRDDPSIGHRWLKLATASDGKRFYREFQPRILAEIDRLDLTGAYEHGSGSSLHVRFASAVRGLSLDRKPNEVWLGYQEVRQDDPFSYFLEILSFLRTQERVFRALGEAFPEVSDPIWPERVRIFTQTIDSLWMRLERVFPEQCERYQRMANRS